MLRTRGITITLIKYKWYYSSVLREQWYFLYKYCINSTKINKNVKQLILVEMLKIVAKETIEYWINQLAKLFGITIALVFDNAAVSGNIFT